MRSVFALCLLAAACASKDPEPKLVPSGEDTTVYDNCVSFAERLCADAEGCCQQAYGDFSQTGCVDGFKREVCRPGADAVKTGHASFHEDAVDACLAAHAKAHEICTPTWAQTLELRKAIYAACRVIDGQTEPGRGCSISSTCKHPEGSGNAECVKNVCRVIEVLELGAECDFPSGSVSVCDDGLACDAPGLGTRGHCIEAIPAGESCDGSVLEGTDCGLGSYCDSVSSTCKLATNRGGKRCAQSNECVSFDCDRMAASCAPAPAVVSATTCLGE